jgi:hypothetical protein
MPGHLADHLLEAKQRKMEELERPRNSLQKHLGRVLGCLVVGPGDTADFGDRGEPVVHLGDVALRLPRIAPGPVNAESPLPRRIGARDLNLVVGARTGF